VPDRTRAGGGQKKARLKGRADKGLEIFFVNEKVCFGKQQLQYSRTHVRPLSVRHTIICYVGRNNPEQVI
jgi:hypothetical protein